jgi:hypothetical protein
MLTKLHAMARRGTAAILMALVACGGADRPPPPPASFDGLPISGSLAYAVGSGFTKCLEDTTEMRCRRSNVMFLGFGPFSAAVDLNGYDGGGGFDQLTLWHDQDQGAFIPLGTALQRQGWRLCLTGEEDRGDQAIYTHPRARARISMDLSYWGKRRLRVIPDWNKREPRC